jgi:hypothetical protein
MHVVRHGHGARAIIVGVVVCLLVALGSASAWAQVRSDFNGDGIGDLAIGAPNEGIVANRVVGGVITPTNIVSAGSVTVIFGTAADGLSTGAAAPAPQLIHQDVNGVLVSVETNDRFGAALAAGDFNGDGFADLAVSVPGDNAVQIFEGGPAGLDLSDDRMIVGTDFVDNQNLALTLKPGLVRGNFNGDAFDDLAIEATEPEGIGVRANVIVLLGSQQFGLQSIGLDIFAFNNANQGGETASANVEMTLAAGDFSGDGADDLAVGLPLADVVSSNGQSVLDGGTVTILQGIAGTLQTGGLVLAGATGLTELNANSIPFPGEHFGATLAVGDFNGDGLADLAVGAPEEDVPTVSGTTFLDAGLVAVFSRGTALHAFYNETPFGQTPQNSERFGAALAAGDFNGDGADDLVIGAPGEVVNGVTGAGAATVLFGILNVGLPRPAQAGLPAITGTVRQFTQATTDITDDPESGDNFGASLTVANLGRTDQADLVIGVPGEDILVSLGGNLNGIETEMRNDAGALHVLYGSATGLQAAGSQRWTQNSANVPDAVEAGDRFGSAFN